MKKTKPRKLRFYTVSLFEGTKYVYSRCASATDRKAAIRAAIKAYGVYRPANVDRLTFATVYHDASTTNESTHRIAGGKVKG